MFKYAVGAVAGIILALIMPLWLMVFVLVGAAAAGAWGYSQYKELPAVKRRRRRELS